MTLQSSNKQKSLEVLDIAKYICAWMVVVIHTTPLKSYSQIGDVYTAQGICRLAVPLFFGISALLLMRKLSGNPADDRGILLRYCRQIFLLYCVWSIVYLIAQIPSWIEAEAIGMVLLLEQLRLFFCEATYYHLWYLLATVYAVPLVYILWRTGKLAMLIAASVLWCLRCLQYTYSWMGVLQLQFIWLQTYCGTILNTLLCAVPLMIMGIFALEGHQKCSSKEWLLRSAIWLVVFFAELTVAYRLSRDKVHFEFLLSTPVAAYHVLCWLLSLKCKLPEGAGVFLRKSSVWIYCVHPLVIMLHNKCSEIVGIRRFLVVAIVCFVSSLFYGFCKMRKGRRNADNGIYPNI